ncbi:MAG: hypothetical protein ACI35P_14990 [Bacillus sp. (in: firmicutes)]
MVMATEELIKKCKGWFLFKKDKPTLEEARGVREYLMKMEPCEDTQWLLGKLGVFIHKQEHVVARQLTEEEALREANRRFDHYHVKLKERGVVVAQPGDVVNGLVDAIHITYHYKGEVVYRWCNGMGIKDMAKQIQGVYERLFG